MLRPLFALGRWDELIRVADELVAWANEHGTVYLGVVAEIRKAHVLALRGATDEAEALVVKFLPVAREIGEPHVLVPGLVVAAIVEESGGTMAGALDRVHEALVALEARSDWDRAQHVQSIVRIALACGDAGAARAALDGLTASGTLHRFGVNAANAALDEHDGRLEAALAAYVAGVGDWERYGFVLERGLASLGAGRTLVSMGRADEAEPHLIEAANVLRGLGAEALAGSADGLRAGSRAPTR
jgi:hypothetical protein